MFLSTFQPLKCVAAWCRLLTKHLRSLIPTQITQSKRSTLGVLISTIRPRSTASCRRRITMARGEEGRRMRHILVGQMPRFAVTKSRNSSSWHRDDKASLLREWFHLQCHHHWKSSRPKSSKVIIRPSSKKATSKRIPFLVLICTMFPHCWENQLEKWWVTFGQKWKRQLHSQTNFKGLVLDHNNSHGEMKSINGQTHWCCPGHQLQSTLCCPNLGAYDSLLLTRLAPTYCQQVKCRANGMVTRPWMMGIHVPAVTFFSIILYVPLMMLTAPEGSFLAAGTTAA